MNEITKDNDGRGFNMSINGEAFNTLAVLPPGVFKFLLTNRDTRLHLGVLGLLAWCDKSPAKMSALADTLAIPTDTLRCSIDYARSKRMAIRLRSRPDIGRRRKNMYGRGT